MAIFCLMGAGAPAVTITAILAVLLGFSAVCYMLLGGRVMGGPRDVGSMPLGFVFICIGLWVLGGAVELIAPSYSTFLIARMGYWTATALMPVMLLICFRQYTGAETSPLAITALLIVPVCSIIIAATNEYHELMWSLPLTNSAGEFLTRADTVGAWHKYVHAPYGYMAVALSILTLLMHSTAVARLHRRTLLVLAGAATPPLIATIAYDLGFGPDTISIVPLVFAGMLPIYAWLIIGEQIIEFSPLAYETVFQNMQDPVIVVDDRQRIIGLNRGAEALLEISEEDAMRTTLSRLFGPEVPEVFEALETGKPRKMMTTTGRFLHLQVTPISTNKAVSRTGRVLMFRDVSDVEKAQKEVQNSEKLLRTLIDHSVNGILRLRWVRDDDGDENLRCIFANSAAGSFIGKPEEELINLAGCDLMVLVSTGMENSETESLRGSFANAARNRLSLDAESMIVRGGRSNWLRVIAEPVGDDMAVTLVDITDRKAKEMQMESIASSDPLTGVLNRRGFERDAAKRLMESEDEATGALLFIDLNDFKQINDEHGHEIGDQLLTIAAQRLKTSLRSCDIIGRPGGDEFVALVPDVKPEVAEKLAVRLTTSLEQPYLIGPNTLDCAASTGLALYPKNANTLTGLMRAADQAMYRAKARCRGADDIEGTDLLEKAV